MVILKARKASRRLLIAPHTSPALSKPSSTPHAAEPPGPRRQPEVNIRSRLRCRHRQRTLIFAHVAPSLAHTTKPQPRHQLKLAAYHIFVDYGRELPQALKEHVATIVLAPRDPNVPLSPNAAKIKQQRRVVAQQNERNGIKRIEPYMLFRGAVEDDARMLAVPLVYSKDEINLHRYFLPPPPDRTVREDWKELSQPRPDTALGYVTRRDAQSTEPPSAAAFTATEERLLDGFCLTQCLLFPFLTSQWKTPNSSENISNAHNQASRDGAVIVNYLHEFYSLAYHDLQPSVVDTAHYSSPAISTRRRYGCIGTTRKATTWRFYSSSRCGRNYSRAPTISLLANTIS